MNRTEPAASPDPSSNPSPQDTSPPVAAPPKPESPLADQIRHVQHRHALFPTPPGQGAWPVVVAVSGGADSVCLLHILAHLAPAWGLSLHVAHMDHALRPESAEDARFVADLTHRLALPFHLKTLPPGHLNEMGGNLEAAARTARRTFLLSVAADLAQQAKTGRARPDQCWPPILALAHTANDQAETVLMHFLRGSGLDGLSGMRAVSQWPLARQATEQADAPVNQYARIVRPLLDVERTQIVRYLSDRGLAWREDASNRDTTFLRNRLRHELLPLLRTINPNLTATLNRTATILAGDADRLHTQDQVQLAALTLIDQPDRRVLDLSALQQLGPATQRGVLRLALSQLLTDDSRDPDQADPLQFDHVDDLAKALSAQVGATGPHPITAGLAWTVATPLDQAAQLGLPRLSLPRLSLPRLSLHRADALPFAPNHPFLDPASCGQAGEAILTTPGKVTVGGWQLHIQPCPPDQLPQDWSTCSPWEAYLDGVILGAPRLSTPQPGQKFAPLGLAGRHKALGDFFTDRKIPRSLRSGWPLLLAEDGRVAWVCGLHVAHGFRITPQTAQIVHLVWQPYLLNNWGWPTQKFDF